MFICQKFTVHKYTVLCAQKIFTKTTFIEFFFSPLILH